MQLRKAKHNVPFPHDQAIKAAIKRERPIAHQDESDDDDDDADACFLGTVAPGGAAARSISGAGSSVSLPDGASATDDVCDEEAAANRTGGACDSQNNPNQTVSI